MSLIRWARHIKVLLWGSVAPAPANACISNLIAGILRNSIEQLISRMLICASSCSLRCIPIGITLIRINLKSINIW